MKLYKSLIKCALCNYSYGHFKENNKSKYICNHYRKNSKCSRRVVTEEDLTSTIKLYCDNEKINIPDNNEDMKKFIDKIYIGEKGYYRIEYKNGHISSWDGWNLKI